MKRALQALLMAPEWHNSCEDGSKLSTVREGKRDYQLGWSVLCCHLTSWCISVDIVKVEHCEMNEVTEEIANNEGFESKLALFKKLKEYYPNIKWYSDVTIIHWKLN